MQAATQNACIEAHRRAMKMAMLTVRNLSDEVHRALRVRAAQRGHSMEAEVRRILESAVSPQGRVKLGSLLADMGRRARLTDEEAAAFEQVRDKAPARPPSFE
jgi:plasmid stability protein